MFHRMTGLILLCGLLVLGVPSTAFAAEIREGQSIVVGPTERIDDDLYAFGSNVTVLGTVTGDVFAAGSTVSVGGTVGGGVYAAGGTVTLSGPVAEDALVAGGTTTVTPTAHIGRDLLMATGSGTISAPVGRNVLAAARELTIDAPIGGDVRAQVGTLRITDSGSVQGSLTYTSAQTADISPGASIVGSTQHIDAPASNTQPTPTFGLGIVDWLRGLVGFAAVGLLAALVFPRFSSATLDTLETRPWSSLGYGFALLAGVPVLAVLVFGLGLVLGGWWLALPLVAGYLFAATIGYVMAAIWVARFGVRRMQRPPQALGWYVVEGLALVGLIGQRP